MKLNSEIKKVFFFPTLEVNLKFFFLLNISRHIARHGSVESR